MKNILVVRNDKIGDFMLAWPSFAMLKTSMPDCRITALVPSYTVALAKACPWIDEVVIDTGEHADKRTQSKLINTLKGAKFDASINLFSTTYNALLVWKAKVPYRLAPATKLAQIFYNKRIKQKRSQSAKPEFEYNLDLIRAFLNDQGVDIIEPRAPYFSFSLDALAKQKEKLSSTLELNKAKPWVYVHAGSGGSANNLTLEQYAELLRGIDASVEVILTAGPGEEEKAKELQQILGSAGTRSVVYDNNDGLVDFSCSLACANVFIAGSTGPLHIAAALDVPTVGFFPAKRSATPLRWKPLNSKGRHIAFCPPQAEDKASQDNMARIDMDKVVSELNPWAAQYLS
ncbi:glycosyltransferase family 9 protein [Vibrio methylphosphonaticus]|uniref:glycosyltransferase family 9 protein n=1 Tax=Vibrio methylphosphonaticus TaxID=2946866 RepID=UPI002029B96B|nr:glycosyltransferase family 9 protein [Vibrio methylphosphonaticus]MCL9777517.1 glycosyltransferase family 9 protein [Vibrio methylphosphonaticus]